MRQISIRSLFRLFPWQLTRANSIDCHKWILVTVMYSRNLSLYPSSLSCRAEPSFHHHYLYHHHHQHHQSVIVSAVSILSHPDLVLVLVIIASYNHHYHFHHHHHFRPHRKMDNTDILTSRILSLYPPCPSWSILTFSSSSRIRTRLPTLMLSVCSPREQNNYCQCAIFFLDTDYEVKWLNGCHPYVHQLHFHTVRSWPWSLLRIL